MRLMNTTRLMNKVRLMTSFRSKKSARSGKSARSKQSRWLSGAPGAVVLGVIAVIVMAMLLGRDRSSVNAASSVQTDSPAAMSESTTQVSKASSAAPRRVKAPESNVTVTVRPAAQAPEKTAVPATIIGCLQRDDRGFRLTNTSGADAPRARSWKSGFLRKGSASVEVVNAPAGLKLSDHLGQRVSVTGMLDERELQPRSLRRVGDSCN